MSIAWAAVGRELFRHELHMRALLDDGACVHHDDLIGMAHCAQSMGDDQRCAPHHGRLKRQLHCGLTLGVQSGRRLIEQQELWIEHEATRNRDALLLAAGELDASFTNGRLIPVAKLMHDEAVRIRGRGRRDHPRA